MAGEWSAMYDLAAQAPPFLLFAGKGGVGKTTCSVATAMALAQSGRKTLVFSTDPAHSLADCLGQRVGPAPAPVSGQPGLHALEIDAQQALAEFRAQYGPSLTQLLTAATYLSEGEAAGLVELGIPGADELMGLRQMVELLDAAAYDHLVWDSAPTGHTLRLLALPDLLDQWVRFLAALQRSHLHVLEQLTGAPLPEPEADILFAVKRWIRRFSAVIRDHRQTAVVAVAMPEAMAVAELERAVQQMRAMGIRTRHLIVNQVAHPHPSCPYCISRAQAHAGQIERIKRALPGVDVRVLPQLAREPRGAGLIRELLAVAPGPDCPAPG